VSTTPRAATGRRAPTIDPATLEYMYGAAKIASWKAARQAVFGNDASLMKTFETGAMAEACLA